MVMKQRKDLARPSTDRLIFIGSSLTQRMRCESLDLKMLFACDVVKPVGRPPMDFLAEARNDPEPFDTSLKKKQPLSFRGAELAAGRRSDEESLFSWRKV
jgi:hypothetical protein